MVSGECTVQQQLCMPRAFDIVNIGILMKIILETKSTCSIGKILVRGRTSPKWNMSGGINILNTAISKQHQWRLINVGFDQENRRSMRFSFYRL